MGIAIVMWRGPVAVAGSHAEIERYRGSCAYCRLDRMAIGPHGYWPRLPLCRCRSVVKHLPYVAVDQVAQFPLRRGAIGMVTLPTASGLLVRR